MAVISKKTVLMWVLIVAGAAAVWRFVWKPMSDEKMTDTRESTTQSGETTPPPSMPTPQGVNDTISMTSEVKEVAVRTSYKNPGGADEVGFVLMVDKGGVIVDGRTEVLATNQISIARQKAFADGFATAVKGKKLAELTAIDKVGGSSLTTASFNSVLSELKMKR